MSDQKSEVSERKQKLIGDICQINKTMISSLLETFSEEDLQNYL